VAWKAFLGVVVVPEDTAADAPDHQAVAADDGLADGPLAPPHVAIDQLPVGECPRRPHVEEGSQVMDRRIHLAVLSRDSALRSPSLGLYLLITRSAPVSYNFSPPRRSCSARQPDPRRRSCLSD
jgi:hypothetical protein